MKGKHLTLGFAALLYLGAVWFVDPFLFGILSFAALFCLGVPAVAISIIILLFAMGTGRSRRPPLILLGVVLTCAMLVGASFFLNRVLHERAVVAAKSYPARVAPLLETYRREHGTYPSSLNQLPAAPPAPRLLRRFGYKSNGRTYSFTFSAPGGLIDEWHYDSKTGEWHLST